MQRPSLLSLAAVLAVAPPISCASNQTPATQNGVVWAVPTAEAPADEVIDQGSPPQATPAAQDDKPVAPPMPSFDPAFVDAATKLAQATKPDNHHAWLRLAEMCDTFGHRLTGSKALEDAIDWAIATMKSDGLDNAHREEVTVQKWTRGQESAELIAPVNHELVLLGLGGTVGTPKRGIEAEVVVVDNLDQVKVAGERGDLKGKIVLINQPMPDYDHEENSAGYGRTVIIRTRGASTASQYGAKAVLVRSVTAFSLRTPHTGVVVYDPAQPAIPAAALSPSDADLVARIAKREKAKIRLKLGGKIHGPAKSGNAIAEIRGREKPEEIVLIGGHIDSWDVGQGAQDDGTGVMMAMEAAYLLKHLNLIPKRTIRVVLFTDEEYQTSGAKAYHEAHKNERHVAAIEADSGSFAPEAIGMSGKPFEITPLMGMLPLFRPLGLQEIRVGGGGADIGPLMRDGTLGMSIQPDGEHYFDFHHTPADTVDHVDPFYLQQNAASMALMAYILAERDEPVSVHSQLISGQKQ